jgi:hypothetical protein
MIYSPKLKFKSWLFMIMAMAMPLQFYRVGFLGLNWSIDRILLLFLIPSIFIYYYNNNFRVNSYVYYIFIWIVIIIVNIFSFYNSNGNTMLYELPTYFLTSFVLVLSISVMKKDFESIINKILIGHAILIIFFGLHSIYHSWILNEIVFAPPFMYEADYSIWIEKEQNHIRDLMMQKRLTFPFATSPHLAFVSGFLILYGLYKSYTRSNKVWLCLLPFLVIILLGSFSRSGILALIISTLIIYLFKKNVYGTRYNEKPITLLLIAFFIVLPASIGVLSQLLDLKLLTRIFEFDTASSNSSFAGHLSIRLRIVKEMFTSDFITFFFGHGIGGIKIYLGASSGHMSFATIFYEMGLVGLLSFTILWGYPFIILVQIGSLNNNPKNIFVISSGVFLFLTHIFYNVTTFVPVWFYLGWVVNNSINNKIIKYNI